jgi:MSHA biogenesis protein MshP
MILRGLRDVLMRLLSTSSESIAQELVATRVYMAANSAMQSMLLKLFPLNRSSTCPLAPGVCK